MRRSPTALAGLLLLAGCELFAGGGGVGARFDACDDAEGRYAWQQAQAALRSGDDRGALPFLIEAAGRCPSLLRAHLAYQDTARRLGGDDEQRMIDFYVEGAELTPPLPRYLRARLAETAYAQANELDTILREHPHFAWGHLSRGRVNRSQGRLSEALRDFERATREDPELFEARLERARVLAALGRAEEAASHYKAYFDGRPADMAALREFMTLLLYRLGRVEEARLYIEMLEAAGDTSLELRMDRAAAMWRAGLPQAAVETYLSVLEEDPTMVRAALNIGLIYYEVVATDEPSRRRYWPKARAAFRLFLAAGEAQDGQERYERTLGVPERLRRIAELLGPMPDEEPTLAELAWPDGT